MSFFFCGNRCFLKKFWNFHFSDIYVYLSLFGRGDSYFLPERVFDIPEITGIKIYRPFKAVIPAKINGQKAFITETITRRNIY